MLEILHLTAEGNKVKGKIKVKRGKIQERGSGEKRRQEERERREKRKREK
jgi:hypothetical protein